MASRQSITISEVIARMLELKEKHGDISVYVLDADTGMSLPITSTDIEDYYGSFDLDLKDDEIIIHIAARY